MTDLALTWNADVFAADLILADGRLATDGGMRTAILISLFSDARAADDDELPENGTDRRGWWGDTQAREAGPEAGTARDANRIGSLLWLLGRAKFTAQALLQAQRACEDALAWLLRDGIASAVRVTVSPETREAGRTADVLRIAVEIDRPSGPARQRHDFTWNASTRAIAITEEPV
ncbi:phage GP46 family protein [Citromicrobium bathyomarinum]|uniref:phage GP46 family protein n=1 Tax=Citromicrobium bathyomarinum TaxID=72174 RepID=UPI00315B262D